MNATPTCNVPGKSVAAPLPKPRNSHRSEMENSAVAPKRVPWAFRIGTRMHGFLIESVETGRRTRLRLRCPCGESFEATADALRAKEVKSCGCHRSQHSFHPLYNTWLQMRARCRHLGATAYSRYGQRGIQVCPEWASFQAFVRDVGVRPSAAHTLDRIDPDVGYCPQNVRWATREQQANNVRRNIRITAFGRTQTLSQWSRELKIDRDFLRHRVQKKGMTLEDACLIWHAAKTDRIQP
jgi:hypothetical protein